MDTSDLARWRVATQGLWRPGGRTPEDVLRSLAASQAQDLLPGRWSLAQRSRSGTTDAAVATALDEGRLLRTHVLRPTWHLVAPDALGWLLAATAPRVHRLNGTMYRQLGIDADLMRGVRLVLERLLSGRDATRAEVGEALAAAGFPAEGVALAHVVMYAELEGWICSGRQRGSQQSYALVEERLGPLAKIDRTDALALLARVFYLSRGPATVRDLAGWASLTLAEARQATDAVRDDLRELELDGRTYLLDADAVAPGREEPFLHLVQAYDEIVSSYPDSREAVLGGRALERERTQYIHPVLVDGRLVGRWRYERDGAGRPVRIVTRLQRELTGEEQELMDAEVCRFATFVGGDVEWR